MRVRVLYFAAVRELVGVEEEALELPEGVGTIAALAQHLEQVREPLRGRLGSVRLARNASFATKDEALADGDEIALIPPVAGG